MSSCENQCFVRGLTLHEQVSTEVSHYVQNINMVSRIYHLYGRWPKHPQFLKWTFNICVISLGHHAFGYKFKSVPAKPIKM